MIILVLFFFCLVLRLFFLNALEHFPPELSQQTLEPFVYLGLALQPYFSTLLYLFLLHHLLPCLADLFFFHPFLGRYNKLYLTFPFKYNYQVFFKLLLFAPYGPAA